MSKKVLGSDDFDELYNIYGAKALRLAAAVIGDKDLAADAVQEAFIRVFKNRERFDTDRAFKPWFDRIVVNECRRILATRQVFADIDSIPEPAAPDDDAQSTALRQEIDLLEPKYRELILLKYMCGYSEEEIARIASLPKSTVKSRLFEARNRLRLIITQEEQ